MESNKRNGTNRIVFLFALLMLFGSEIMLSQEENKTGLTTIETKKVTERNPVPAEQKTSIEAFYIINDKPVSREEYLQYLDRKATGKKADEPKKQ